MTIAQAHKEYVLERLHKKYLLDNIIPTSDQLEDDLAEYQLTYPYFEEPTMKRTTIEVGRGGHSSSSFIQNVGSAIDTDATILSREMYRLATESQKFYDRWLIEIKRLGSFARSLEDRVDSLLLLETDTFGFFASVSDTFVDMNKIDTENTTAKISIREGGITINPDYSEVASKSDLINITNLTENDVEFAVLSNKPGLNYGVPARDNALVNMIKTNNAKWVGNVSAKKNGPLTCELKIRISPGEDLEVSKIAMEYTGENTTSRSTVTCLYSDNGYDWKLVPVTDATKVLTNNISWKFPKLTLRWVKFIFWKPSADNGSYNYQFSISSLRFYGTTYLSGEGQILQSNSLSALNKEDEEISFSSLALQTCEVVPDGTSLDYRVSVSKDNSVWSDWKYISPTNREGVDKPKIVNVGGIDWKHNVDESSTVVFEDSLDRRALTSSIGIYDGYRLKAGTLFVNSVIPYSVSEDPDVISNSVVVWRNISERSSFPDLLTVREVPRGWGKDGNQYSCYFEVFNSSGKTIDFGDKECLLDGNSTTGIVLIEKGVHKFQTIADHWFDISEEASELVGPLEDEEMLKQLDPLYPYNHKLLIEGMPYPVGFKGTQVYTGTDVCAEFFSNNKSLFHLENNSGGSYGNFAVRGVGTDQNPALAVITNFDGNNSDFVNELFLVKWKAGATDSTMYKYVKLQAILSTTDSLVSPSLESYRLKLGI